MTRYKNIPYGKQYLDRADLENLQNSLSEEKITQGRLVEKFEIKLKKYFKTSDAITCTSGTAALHLAFLASNLKKNDVVVMPSINFVAAYNLASSMGAKVILSDVNDETGQMTPETLKECIKKHKLNKIKIIVTMYLGGSAENINEFYNIKLKYKCILIEDACHAFGSKYIFNKKKIKVGSCKHSDFCCFSLHPIKAITTGEGGIITTRNKNIGKKIRQFRSHGLIRNRIKYWDYKSDIIGMNYRLSDINCSIGISQLSKINLFLKKRTQISKNYINKFKNLKNYITIPKYEESNYNSWHLFIVKIEFSKLRQNKDHLIGYLNKFKIYPQFHYKPLYRLKKMSKQLIKKYPLSETYYKNNISLPIYVGLTKKDQLFVIKKIQEFINLYKKK